MGETKKTYLQTKYKAREVHSGLNKPGARHRQEVYHILMNQRQDEEYGQ